MTNQNIKSRALASFFLTQPKPEIKTGEGNVAQKAQSTQLTPKMLRAPHSDFSFRMALLSSQDSGTKKGKKKLMWYYFNKEFSLLSIWFPKHELSLYTSVLFLQVARNIHRSFFDIAALLGLDVNRFSDWVMRVHGGRNRDLVRLDWLLIVWHRSLPSHDGVMRKLVSPTEHVGYRASHHHGHGRLLFSLHLLGDAVFY